MGFISTFMFILTVKVLGNGFREQGHQTSCSFLFPSFSFFFLLSLSPLSLSCVHYAYGNFLATPETSNDIKYRAKKRKEQKQKKIFFGKITSCCYTFLSMYLGMYDMSTFKTHNGDNHTSLERERKDDLTFLWAGFFCLVREYPCWIRAILCQSFHERIMKAKKKNFAPPFSFVLFCKW